MQWKSWWQQSVTVMCHWKVSLQGVTVRCHCEVSQRGVTVKCHCKVSQGDATVLFSVTVRCHCEMSLSRVTWWSHCKMSLWSVTKGAAVKCHPASCHCVTGSDWVGAPSGGCSGSYNNSLDTIMTPTYRSNTQRCSFTNKLILVD